MRIVALSQIGYDPLPARAIEPEGRIGKPVLTGICYMGNFEVTYLATISSVFFLNFHSRFCMSSSIVPKVFLENDICRKLGEKQPFPESKNVALCSIFRSEEFKGTLKSLADTGSLVGIMVTMDDSAFGSRILRISRYGRTGNETAMASINRLEAGAGDRVDGNCIAGPMPWTTTIQPAARLIPHD